MLHVSRPARRLVASSPAPAHPHHPLLALPPLVRPAPRAHRALLREHTVSSTASASTASTATPATPATPTTHDVAVLGGGITGLATAYFLTRRLRNAKVTIYEASERMGGWVNSTRVPVRDGSVLFEKAIRTFRPQANGVLTASLVQELDLAKDAIFTQNSSPAARSRYVYYPDHLVRMPHPSHGIFDGLWSLMTEPVFQTVIYSALTEVFKDARDPKVQDESIGHFFARRFSKPMVDRLLSAVIHGIYAGDVWQLSAKSLFPNPWRAEAQHDSVIYGSLKMRSEGVEMTKREADFLQEMKGFNWDPLLKATLSANSVFTFRDGASMLTDRLYAKLFETGRVEFKPSTPVQSIAQAEGNTGIQVTIAGSQETHTYTHAISTLAPWHLNEVAKSSSTPLVPTIPSVTVMTVNLYFRTPGLHEPGFGYLIPQATPFENNPERALGVVFDDAYSPSTQDVDPSNWQVLDADKLKEYRDQGRLINVNDFAWYNMPDRPNVQDDVKTRGTKVTVMLGGHWWNDWPAFPDEHEGLAMARSVLERHLGIKEEPEAWQVNLEEKCIPQYTVGHEQRLKQAHNNLWRDFKGRLRVAGNWMSGVGANDCLRSAYEVAKNMSKDATGLEHVGEVPTVKLRPVRPGQKARDD